MKNIYKKFRKNEEMENKKGKEINYKKETYKEKYNNDYNGKKHKSFIKKQANENTLSKNKNQNNSNNNLFNLESEQSATLDTDTSINSFKNYKKRIFRYISDLNDSDYMLEFSEAKEQTLKEIGEFEHILSSITIKELQILMLLRNCDNLKLTKSILNICEKQCEIDDTISTLSNQNCN